MLFGHSCDREKISALTIVYTVVKWEDGVRSPAIRVTERRISAIAIIYTVVKRENGFRSSAIRATERRISALAIGPKAWTLPCLWLWVRHS